MQLPSARPDALCRNSFAVKPQNNIRDCKLRAINSATRSSQIRVTRKQGNQNRAQKPREDHYTPEKIRWSALEKPVAPLPSPPPTGNSFRLSVSWSWRRDSNPRPSDYKSDALPTELRQHCPGQMRRRANLSL